MKKYNERFDERERIPAWTKGFRLWKTELGAADIMILYYTGTGNSEYVAKKIGEQTEDKVINLFDKIKGHDYSEIHSDSPFVFVYPTYAWQMPRILEAFMHKTVFSGDKKTYFVTTCGVSMGNMPKYLMELCSQKGLRYMGCAEIVMPENYIAMFSAPDRTEAVRIIKGADTAIKNVAAAIRRHGTIAEKKISILAKISTGVVNSLFYALLVSAKKFYATDSCIGCGKCAEVCPLGNINIKNAEPVWGNACTHCMACICKCPKEAIEYGNRSKGKQRYQCPL